MSKRATVLAFDLGASSGRAIAGRFEKETGQLTIEELHRFHNDPVKVGGHLHWDILRLFHEMKMGIVKARQLGFDDVESIGIDSWAVDFGLLDEAGELLGNPYHYRDYPPEVMEEVTQRLGKERIFAKTGLQFLPFNTLFQLAALHVRQSTALGQAKTLLMIPDLLRYFLTGEKHSEFTNASTTQLLNATTGDWDTELLGELGVSAELLVPPVRSGTKVGALTAAISDELSVPALPVIAVGEHDTASAVAAVPAVEPHFAYLICGTWSLLGTELQAPLLSEQALAWNFTNEGGVYGTNRLLKNIMGLWLIQECKRAWDKEGRGLSFARLVELAEEAEPLRCFIDPDALQFLNPPHMPEQIREYCRTSGQFVPQTEGEIARCVFESLAFKYRYVLERTESLTGNAFKGLHMVGGGINNEFLCRMTANACLRPVWSGPVEASALGNVAVQLITLGHIADLQEARQIIRHSFPLTTYEPENGEKWNEAYRSFLRTVSL